MLARSSPVLQKLGQVLARDQRLSPTYGYTCDSSSRFLRRFPWRRSEHLATRARSARPPRRDIDAARDRGSQRCRGHSFPAKPRPRYPRPIRSSLSADGCGQDAAQGVFKILKPGIQEQLALELSLLEKVGEHLDLRCDELKLPHLDYQESFQQVKEKLLDEVLLENEQRHLAQARRFFADEPQVEIPDVLLDHCTSQVTAMSRISGVKVTDHQLSGRSKKRRLGQLVARMMIAKPIFSKAGQAPVSRRPPCG